MATDLPEGLLGVLFNDDRGFVGAACCLTDEDDIDDGDKCTTIFDYDKWFAGDLCTRCHIFVERSKEE